VQHALRFKVPASTCCCLSNFEHSNTIVLTVTTLLVQLPGQIEPGASIGCVTVLWVDVVLYMSILFPTDFDSGLVFDLH